jgi:hypothetical protein
LAFLGAVVPSFSAAPFTGVSVILVPASAHVGPIESAVDRLLEVVLGCITALAVSLLVLPARANSVAIEPAARALELMVKLLPELFQGILRPLDSASIQRIQDSIVRGSGAGTFDRRRSEARTDRFLAASRTWDRCGGRCSGSVTTWSCSAGRRRAAFRGAPGATRTAAFRIAEGAADYLHGSADPLADRRGPETAEAAFDERARMIATLREEGLTLGLPVDAAERLFTLGFALEQMRQELRDLDRCGDRTRPQAMSGRRSRSDAADIHWASGRPTDKFRCDVRK